MSTVSTTDGKTTNIAIAKAKSPCDKTAKRVTSSFDIRTMDVSAAETTSEQSLTSQSTVARYKTSSRYIVSLLVLYSVNVVLIVTARMALSDSTLGRMLASLLIPIIAFFTYEWTAIHSSGLTRKSRAFWNEANILLTYQPRARFEGHKFKPDPPTPGPNMPPLLKGGCMGMAPQEPDEDEAKNQREAFEASRNAHYANEFALALKGRPETPLSDGVRVDAYAPGSPIMDEALQPISPNDWAKGEDKKLQEDTKSSDFKTSEQKNEAATKDPQYQTLIGLSSEATFGTDKSSGVKEKKGANPSIKVVQTEDPQYETLAGLENDQLFQKKDDSSTGADKGAEAPKNAKYM